MMKKNLDNFSEYVDELKTGLGGRISRLKVMVIRIYTWFVLGLHEEGTTKWYVNLVYELKLRNSNVGHSQYKSQQDV